MNTSLLSVEPRKGRWLGFLWVAALSFLWAGAVMTTAMRLLGVSVVSMNGGTPSLLREFVWYAEGSIVFLFLAHLLFALVLWRTKSCVSWRVGAGAMLLIGTPIAMATTYGLSKILWAWNLGGFPWEKALPASIGMIAAWMAAVFWERRSQKRALARVGLCAGCRYDLRGQVELRCPECGRRFS